MHNHVIVSLSMLSALGIVILHFYSKRVFKHGAVGYFDLMMWLVTFSMVGGGIYFFRMPEAGYAPVLCFSTAVLSFAFSFYNMMTRTNWIIATLASVLIIGSSLAFYVTAMFLALNMIFPLFLYFAVIRPIFSQKVKA